MTSFSWSQRDRSAVRCSDSSASWRSSAASRSLEALSVSFFSAWRSISSWRICRSSSSSSAGIESISVRSRAAASSMRSIALSGRKRSVM